MKFSTLQNNLPFPKNRKIKYLWNMAREFLQNLILTKLNENKGSVPQVVAQNLDHSVISNTLGLGLWL